MKLKGRVALVTGGARAIGRAHALRLAGLGANVVVNDVDLKSYKEFGEQLTADSIVDEIRRMGVRCLGIEADVTDKNQVMEMIRETVETFGSIDILINNAGGLAGEPVNSYASRVPEADLRATIDRNLIGTIFCCQEATVHMKERKWGRIVNTSSQGGMQAQSEGFYASYGAAKAGVIAYTKYLAQELGPHGILVNCVAPAYVSTARLEKKVFSLPGMREQLLSQVPLGRFAQPDDIAKVVEFFVTDLGDYVTGQCLSVCGGAIRF